MTVAEYAKDHGVSKQSVYDKLRRGTLSYEVKDGIKHIVESVAPVVGAVAAPGIDKKLKRALKRLNKLKHKLEMAVNDIQGLQELIRSKDSEIDTLKKTFGLMTAAIENKLLAAPHETVIVNPVKSKKSKDKKKRKK